MTYQCPTCGPTDYEYHPADLRVIRCVNCKEPLTTRCVGCGEDDADCAAQGCIWGLFR